MQLFEYNPNIHVPGLNYMACGRKFASLIRSSDVDLRHIGQDKARKKCRMLLSTEHPR